MAGIPRWTYEGARAEITEGARAAVNMQSYCWALLSRRDDGGINGVAKSICHICTDGSIDVHMLYYLAC